MQLVDDSYAAQAEFSGSMEPGVMQARDGVTLHGHLSRTTQEKSRGLVMNIHGGPHGPFDIWGYRAEIQFLTSIGFDVLQVNFRGLLMQITQQTNHQDFHYHHDFHHQYYYH